MNSLGNFKRLDFCGRKLREDMNAFNYTLLCDARPISYTYHTITEDKICIAMTLGDTSYIM